MLAVLPVREGSLPLGGAEAVAEAGGRALVIGPGAAEAATHLDGVATVVGWAELPEFAPAAWANALAPLVSAADVVVLPGSPDGRDLAPRLAHLLRRPLLAGAMSIAEGGATVAVEGGLVLHELVVDGPFVATLQPGVRGVDLDPSVVATVTAIGDLPLDADRPSSSDPVLVELVPADPATMDLAESPRIVGGGAGLGDHTVMDQLGLVADALGCSTGGTRVITDWGWLPFERQIGTTGVMVHPRLYLAFGVSGAVQHVAGLGDPSHVIAVNTDASCPMMSMADLAIVTDGPALVAELARRLGVAADGRSADA
jgi:electron transfer flavoprotein alpha subunit